MVVVFDSDVLIPLILPASRSTRLFLRLTADSHIVAVSQPILAETSEKMRTSKKLRAWLELPDTDMERFLGNLPALCRVTPGNVTVQGAVKDDPDDDKILAAAVESAASYIVSEDRHLRKLGRWHGIEIMNRQEFEAELDRLGVPALAKEENG